MDDDPEIIFHHLANNDLRITIRDVIEMSDHEMIAFCLIKLSKAFIVSFPEKQGQLKQLLDAMFQQERDYLN
jgi:hypothetical protein